ncbi:tubulin epsilon and delta complex protein 1-like [Nylanderia fulva]|uniref:tubulin epsilon and delta complex protein 1-like n=1 Tax=Nylanderia fulva TaxID=613905 RepID=UPI0010FAEAA7|nr:tubulin epsilon and delta complex protein 1-like [Nylanderia fulva]
MSDVRDALLALCNYINSLINVGLTPEHLRLAKFNAPDGNVTETLRNTLHVFSYHAAREKRSDVDFRNYDKLMAVKLHLAFLEYPAIEFYSLSQSNKDRNRDLLLALAWLLGMPDVLSIVLRAKLAGGVLGFECSHVDPSEESVIRPLSSIVIPDDQPTTVQLASLLHLNTRVNLNLREISELTQERANLVSKVHAASVDVSGLPHLSVSESSLTKRLATTSEDSESPGEAEDRRRKYRDAGILLDARIRWLRKRQVFFDWMVTVIQEQRRATGTSPKNTDSRELVAFSSLLRRVIRKRLRVLASADAAGGKSRSTTLDCPSRGLRSLCDEDVEARNWLDDLNERQRSEEEDLQRNRKRLADELEEMLKLIPSIVRV